MYKYICAIIHAYERSIHTVGIINILDKQTANLIAAGEVVERPSSAIKEMLENSADAGSKNITVEIKNGGTTYIRITDDGKGMTRDDVPKAILRHATSKIKDGRDLEAIGTYGFRGEALAAICAVSKVRILTRCKEDISGTLFECHFGEQTALEDAGCPNGTTITVENIFENVPARRKFLKKDSTEALSVLASCEKFSLSRPDIALTFISDNNIKLQTPGDGSLKSAIYSCLGREFVSNLIEVSYSYSDITIHGYIGKPEFCRPNRNMQNFFVNNRYIRSRTMLAAIEEGFRGFCPVGKFPACVLFCDIDLRLVDVNVHPAKLEIKFSDERKVFDSVYFAVKNALANGVTFNQFDNSDGLDSGLLPFTKTEKNGDTHDNKKVALDETLKKSESDPSFNEKQQSTSIEKTPAAPTKESPITITNTGAHYIPDVPDIPQSKGNNVLENKQNEVSNCVPIVKKEENLNFNTVVIDSQKQSSSVSQFKFTDISQDEKTSVPLSPTQPKTELPTLQKQVQNTLEPKQTKQVPIYVGEVFDTYLVVQNKSSMYLIDKHAAHERIIYERLKNPDYTHSSQFLLEGINVFLTPKEAESVRDNKAYFENIGFEFDEFGSDSFIIRAVPLPIAASDVKDVFTFLAGRLSEGNTKSAGEIFDRALFTSACRAAIKGGDKHTDIDNKMIIDEVFNNDAVLYCPHGRPVIVEFSRTKLEKLFDRI